VVPMAADGAGGLAGYDDQACFKKALAGIVGK
jgi:hypothetical protein